MSQSFDKRAMNFIPPATQTTIISPSEQNASFITHHPHYYLWERCLF